MLPEHAGFLLALGLNGHLKQLDRMNLFDYLSKQHEMTRVAILLGLSATFRGTYSRIVEFFIIQSRSLQYNRFQVSECFARHKSSVGISYFYSFYI